MPPNNMTPSEKVVEMEGKHHRREQGRRCSLLSILAFIDFVVTDMAGLIGRILDFQLLNNAIGPEDLLEACKL